MNYSMEMIPNNSSSASYTRLIEPGGVPTRSRQLHILVLLLGCFFLSLLFVYTTPTSFLKPSLSSPDSLPFYAFPPTGDLKSFITDTPVLLSPRATEDTRDKREYDAVHPVAISASSTPRLTVIVPSRVSNFEPRQAIRETWGKWIGELDGGRLIFILGQPHPAERIILLPDGSGRNLTDEIRQEAATHGDILQMDFIDSYYNLTLKSLFMLNYYVKQVMLIDADSSRDSSDRVHDSYLIKIDDDMWFNVPNLLQILPSSLSATSTGQESEANQRPWKPSNLLLMGSVQSGVKPDRSQSDKYYVPFLAYPDKQYPDYLSGTGYVMSSTVAKHILDNALSRRCPYIHMEDIYITGLCSQVTSSSQPQYPSSTLASSPQTTTTLPSLIVSPVNYAGFNYLHVDPTDLCSFVSSRSPLLVTSHHHSPQELRSLWTAIHAFGKLSAAERKQRCHVSFLAALFNPSSKSNVP